MSSWPALRDELDRWRDAGRAATLWWRDDDAIRPTPALERLLALAAGPAVPLALAVVPATAEPALGERLAAAAGASVLQHGWRHLNLAPAGARKAELHDGRPAAAMLADLVRGGARLRRLFAAPLAVLVPPWNRLPEDLVDRLRSVGLHGLSRFKPRRRRDAAAGLVEANCHVDPIDWHGGRGFAGEAAALAQLVGHLEARRRERVDSSEPSGLLTHHLQHDENVWRFLAHLLEMTAAHPAGHWLRADDLFTGRP